MNKPNEVASDASDFQYIWQSYAQWDDENIKGFFGSGKYYFLSNFKKCEIHFDGDVYVSTENAYQAAKFPRDMREPFFDCTPREAKIRGNDIDYYTVDIPWWNSVKQNVMYQVCFDKFYRHEDLKRRLLATQNKYLEETNSWNDVYWGVDYKTRKGENKLGKTLMTIRAILSSLDNKNTNIDELLGRFNVSYTVIQ